MRISLAFLCLSTFFVNSALACSAQDIIVSDAVISKPLKGKNSISSFMTIRNKCAEDLKLLAVEAPFKNITELHDMKHEGGIMKMYKVDSIDIAANSVVHLKRGGMHVMFMKLEGTIDTSEPVNLKVKFDKDLEVETTAIFKEMKGGDHHKKH
ncbi:MAG: copper chaperone PCu(A)C [Alphaproteobacteria bacterium]|nr:copper chaperone PCu(A)C [Alphaproteobacteria bacterium]OJV13472.1 MAG: hypothetical protein BGO27_04595 [Alphaproteobacteria bacterium 33-17]